MKRQIGWCLAVLGGALLFAFTIAAFMDTAPGLLPLFPLALVWWAKDLPVFDIDRELALLLEA